ncbi:MAG: tRNA (adenosine(37)-N6)-threonylcarbamoyltransferase complex transferase subunit TsaD, partial [Desulfocapsa sp.]|nr:tRNA (adenosine(37)-N6)-threonylcarbamoyltransferase complex transferase subunit TsaD [Desulfocapsa sp.]
EAVVDTLTKQTLRCAVEQGLKTILVAGGVASNRRLRAVLRERAEADGRSVHYPTPDYCTDNAVMIGGLGWHLLEAPGARDLSLGLALDASPR